MKPVPCSCQPRGASRLAQDRRGFGYPDLTEARVRDEGKPRLTHAEVKKRFGIK